MKVVIAMRKPLLGLHKACLMIFMLLPLSALGHSGSCPTPGEFRPVVPYELPDEINERIAGTSAVKVVSFWALWCRPCLRELPLLDQLANHARFDIDAIHIGDEEQKIRAMFDRLKISRLSTAHFSDFEPVRALGFVGIPSTLVAVNRKVRYQTMGYISTSEEMLEQWLVCLEKEQRNETD
ncbi:TlpA family protein disulfide reductase [Photobacterium sp. J15]|uniref:TlpA family protein disulfide reductase n=1 Tax=Photobacterium sp. J15 TaxID=265901 RepID=UPI0007E4DB1C|nr:TlpA disulfide reductase family protein [Photobacterium sp. J15]